MDSSITAKTNREHLNLNRQVAIVAVVRSVFAGDTHPRDQLAHESIITDADVRDQSIHIGLVFKGGSDQRTEGWCFQLPNAAARHKLAVVGSQKLADRDRTGRIAHDSPFR